MFVLASPTVDWNAIWKICLVALAAGAGTVVIFGFLLLGLKVADGAGTGSARDNGSRFGGLTVAILSGAVCIGIIVLGIYAMTQK